MAEQGYGLGGCTIYNTSHGISRVFVLVSFFLCFRTFRFLSSYICLLFIYFIASYFFLDNVFSLSLSKHKTNRFEK